MATFPLKMPKTHGFLHKNVIFSSYFYLLNFRDRKFLSSARYLTSAKGFFILSLINFRPLSK